jgi:hypothetical protein
MSVATLQSVISAWRSFGRWKRPTRAWGSLFSYPEDADAVWSEEQEQPVSVSAWSQQDYADEQMRGLVRQVFLSEWSKPGRQVVFSAVHESTNIAELCTQVATILAEEVRNDVCLVGGEAGARLFHEAGGESPYRRTGLRSKSGQISSNLWTVPQEILWENQRGTSAVPGLCRQLEELKRDFEYSVIEGPAAGTHRRAALLGQLCDGVVLVLQADSTRRIAAQRARELLISAGVRVLGAVLCDRKFPVPEAIYRRL